MERKIEIEVGDKIVVNHTEIKSVQSVGEPDIYKIVAL